MIPTVLVVDDERAFRELYAGRLKAAGFEVVAAATAEDAREIVAADPPAMIVSDVRMPGEDGIGLLKHVRDTVGEIPFLLVTAHPDVRQAVKALKLGAVDYLEKPVDLDELVTAVADSLGHRMKGSDHDLELGDLGGIVAESPAMRLLLQEALKVARSEATVLITGESGTGKEVIANFLHTRSARRARPLVAVNCAAIPESLLGSEMFGHEKGAFTGATSPRLGLFREADGGTLFLDEVGDMPLPLQATLLRAIETRCVTPLGGTGEVKVDLRLLFATNRDLLAEVKAGRFREDLYYRVNVISLEAPALRDRPEDLRPLARRFLTAPDGRTKRLSPAALRAVLSYDWPGNVRELANAMERARILSNTDVILPEHLPPKVRQPAPGDRVTAGGGVLPLDQVERISIENALVETDQNQTKAAKLLGISRRTLVNKLRRYRLEGRASS